MNFSFKKHNVFITEARLLLLVFLERHDDSLLNITAVNCTDYIKISVISGLKRNSFRTYLSIMSKEKTKMVYFSNIYRPSFESSHKDKH